MNNVKVSCSCPLGHKCETHVLDNSGQIVETNRCAWYTTVAGQNPQTGEQIDQAKCAMAWIPILLVENAMTNRGQTDALVTFRNEMVEGQKTSNQILLQTAANRIAAATIGFNN
jgi:hypothetical protein